MLLNLPKEIVLSISSLLDFRAKLRLSATCKKLNDLISKTNLYESLNLTDQRVNVKRAIQEFEKKPFRGAQVKTLQLRKTNIPGAIVPELSRIFPKVTRFIFSDFSASNNFEGHPISEPLATWINTLETYDAKTDWKAIWYALQHHSFPRLTAIEIEKEKNDFMHTGFGPFFMPSIKNAPALKKLTLRHCGWTLNFLEDLHANSPHLESLRFEFCLFKINNNTLPETIIPATSVLHLEISDLICFDANGLLLDYIAKKYPNLARLCLTLEVSKYHIATEFDDFYPGSYYLFSNSDSDDDVEDNDDEEIPITRNEYNKWFSDLTSALETYRASSPTFFPSLPKSIKSLQIHVEGFNNAIEAVVKSDLKLAELDYGRTCTGGINKLEDPYQILYLSQLTSLKTMSLSYNISSDLLNHQEPISTSITRLVFKVEGNPLHIDWLLSVFPSLEYLYVLGDINTIVKVGDEAQVAFYPRTIHANLQKLRMDHVNFQDSTFDYIKVVAPNVKELNLFVCLDTQPAITKEETVQPYDFSGWDLEKCSIHFLNMLQYNEKRYCKVTIENVTTRFVFPNGRNPVTFQNEPFDFKDFKVVVYLDIKCDNIKHLEINAARVKKIGNKITVTR